ncbi:MULTISPECIES: P22 phage major capsid protein family protein [Dehalobacter]|uniref:P22 phage major capsid protein family protein n=1 Tax=Dehalobacter TaxID=56112 RepID=UPI0025866E5A|nr:P22 phage major capsid protein family protein [Dehalobacter sp.]MDJ0305386.1 P22 coat protein [Dehalobacter sp.]
MSNTFITVKEIARQVLPRLISNLVFPNLIHKDYSQEFVTGKGATIQVKKPVILTANDFDENAGVTAQGVTEQSVEVTLDKLATVDVEFGAIQRAVNVDDLNRLFLEPAAIALAEKINSDGLFLYKDIPYTCGVAGTTPDALTDLSDVRLALNTNKVPVLGRIAVWDPNADAKFTTIDAIVNAEKSGTTQALREGSIGRIFSLDNFMSQDVKAHATGITTATTLKVNGAVLAGATKLAIDGTALVGKFVKGDIITISAKNYTVTEDSAAAAANAIAEVKVYPALPAIADDTAVTLVANHTANLAFNPNAFAFVTRPLSAPAGVEAYVTSYNGVTLRVVRGYDMKYKKEMLSMDVLYGYKTMYPELAVRALG